MDKKSPPQPFTPFHTAKTTSFQDQHLPKVPDFIKTNVPRVQQNDAGVFEVMHMGAPVVHPSPKTLLDDYFGGNTDIIFLDMQRRPDHYTPKQRAIVDAIREKRPLPDFVQPNDLSELVLTYVEATQQRKKRQEIVQKVEKKTTEDPTIARKLEETEASKDMPMVFEHQADSPATKFIKII